MKKYVIMGLSLIFLAGTVCNAALYTKFSSKFIKNFEDCDNYEETVQSEFENSQFTTKRKIVGWRNGFCRYETTIIAPTSQYKLICNFSSTQVDELYEAMKSRSKELEKYELDIFTEQTDKNSGTTKYVKTGTTTIKGNKAAVVWAKYENNPYFCLPQKIK